MWLLSQHEKTAFGISNPKMKFDSYLYRPQNDLLIPH